jgi:hypothetical protein
MSEYASVVVVTAMNTPANKDTAAARITPDPIDFILPFLRSCFSPQPGARTKKAP